VKAESKPSAEKLSSQVGLYSANQLNMSQG